MKVVYLNIGSSKAGVQKKIGDKISQLNSFPNTDVRLFHVIANKESGNLENTIHAYSNLANRISGWPFFWRLSVIIQQRKIYFSIGDFISKNPFDLIIMRYPGADFFLWRFLVSVKVKVVFEHNTLELEELKLRAGESYWYKFFYWSERFFGESVRMNAAGLIGVTNEITHRQAKLSKNRVPVCTISNGIELKRISVRKGSQYYPGQRLNLLFLAGSEAPWHGVDILLNSIASYNQQDGIHCTIAGNIDPEAKARISKMSNVVHQATLLGDSLDRIVEESHIGIGSLALFRNNMNEASTLKVREYWARCIPFVLGYHDTDVLACPEASAFCLRIEVDRSTLAFDIQEVIDFAEKVYGKPGAIASIRESAARHIDYRIKCAAYVDFLSRL